MSLPSFIFRPLRGIQFALVCLAILEFLPAAEIDYGRDIRPLLARRCYPCHGTTKAEGGLRLDRQESALAELDSGEKAIVPGDVAASILLARVASHDESERMPPEGDPLKEGEIARLQDWIAQGAPWNDHWAFQPRTKPPIPVILGPLKDWCANPVDAFIAQRLAEANLSPAPPADRRALLRRAAYDLTGLPPSHEEMESFVHDPDVRAFEKRIDLLLESPHYGEKWGRHWLDLLRFAETNSFERDADKPHAYRFRDYVIQSFNLDKPMDQFIRELLAGDELPHPTADSLIATGFYRLGLWDDEPSDPEQLKFDVFDDIVKTTSQVFLGLTMDCARCHDHKIDPILQKDYYQLVAFFANITPMQTRGPNIEREVFQSDEERSQYEAQLADWESQRQQIYERIRSHERAFAQAVSPGSELVPRFDLELVSYSYYEGQWNRLPDFSSETPIQQGEIASRQIDLSKRNRDVDFGFVFEAILRVPKSGEYEFSLEGNEGYRLSIGENKIIDHAGGGSKDRAADKATLHLEAGRIPLVLEYFQGGEDFDLKLRWRSFDQETGATEFASLTADDIKMSHPDFWPLVSEAGDRVFQSEVQAGYKADLEMFRELTKKRPTPPMALCVTEYPSEPPATHILSRGNPHVLGDEVRPGFPAILGGGEAKLPIYSAGNRTSGRRLALAEWITHPDNPLTARVLANRIFQYHFGRGIVRSANNFGLGGDSPTHPELLDWLADQIIIHDWRLKPIHRLIMTSNAYKMSHGWSEQASAVDPTNDRLWRFDLRRLTAEELRDSFLVANGSLNRKMFGPGFYPRMPEAVLQTQSMPGNGWGESSDEERARRSVYIHVKRSLLTPLLESFDLAETDNSCPVRFVTTQPTQALGLLNSDYMQQQADVFARRLIQAGAVTPKEQIYQAYAWALGREPSDTELFEGLSLIQDLKSKHQSQDEEALRQLCLMILNLNEFIYVD